MINKLNRLFKNHLNNNDRDTIAKVNEIIDYLNDNPIPESLYKVYNALFTQSGTNAPVSTILENTLSGTPVWSRSDIGQYRLTLAGEFTLDKVYISGFQVNIGTDGLPPAVKTWISINGGSHFYTIYRIDNNTLALDIADNVLAFIADYSDIFPADSSLSLPEIRVYI